MKELLPYKVKGYWVVDLYCNGEKNRCKIHRLVALHFIPNPRNLNIVNHIDNNPLNNVASNLEWCTNKENINNPNSNIVKPIMRYTLNDEYIDEKPSITRYKEDLGFQTTQIIKCAKGYKTSYRGYKWKYKNRIKNNN